MSNKKVALAFSGGLDTSFCVPYLREKGYDVVTLFVDTGGVSAEQRAAIADRALSLGAVEHVTEDAGEALWEQFVVPFVMGGSRYQDQYPLLCSDRYVIAERLVALGERLGAVALAHGCTAMGNDQVRFDQSLACLSGLPVLAPIREIQAVTASPRRHEMESLRSLGHEVEESYARYTINENVLGVTISGSEIDEFEAPRDDARRITAARRDWPEAALEVTIGFERGRPVSLDGESRGGAEMLAALNERLGAYGVGRGVYTGDTVIGLKGRIVYEAPGLVGLLTAHRALEETTLSRAQNSFKSTVADKWTELAYTGLFFEPLREELEAYLIASQRSVTGEVTIRTEGGACDAVRIASANRVTRDGMVYAQSAPWTAGDAEGFIKLFGLSSVVAAEVGRRAGSSVEGKPGSTVRV